MADDDDVGFTTAAAAISPLSGPQGEWATHFVQVALKTSFGPIVQVVGDSLMSRGAQSLDELYKHTQLDVATLKKALLTLIQQDIVMPRYEHIPLRPGSAAAAAHAKKPRPPRVIYALQVDSMRHRSRYAHYLLWIKQCFGPECEYILQTLLVHGKLSSAQVMELTCASIEERGRLAAQEIHRVQMAQAIALAAKTGAPVVKPPPPQPVQSSFDRSRIHDVFRQLVASQYIKRAQGLIRPEEIAAKAAAEAAQAEAEANGSSGVNLSILQTFLANNAAIEAKANAEREAAEAAAAAQSAQESLRASTAAAVAADKASSSTAAGGKKRKKIIRDDDEDEDGEGAGGEDAAAAAAAKPAAKRAKKKTKKELEAEAKEAKLAEIRAARAKEEADIQASLDRSAAAAAASSSDAAGGAAAAAGAGGDIVHDDDNILWCVNHSQFVWEFRKKAVIDYVAERHSAACSFIVAQMMREYKPNDSERPPIYDTDAIVALCEQAADKQQVLNPVPSEDVAEECTHQMMADPTHFFERKTQPRGYLINFQSLFDELRLKHIQSLCRARYGSLASRIFRCLLQSHRLEETQLSELCTAPRKNVRSLLYIMHRAGLVSLQEVPRTSDRMPAKTFYLWGVPRTEVCARFLESLYFSWCNLRLRAAGDSERAKPVLDKVDTSRTITEQEKAQVEQWKKAADRMEMGMHQINQIIMLFNDF